MTCSILDFCKALEGELCYINENEAAMRKVSGIAYDSREVKDNYMFFCLVGEKVNGSKFILDAIENGASCIVCEFSVDPAIIQGIKAKDGEEVIVIRVDDSRVALAQAACLYNNYPSSDLSIIGVTGTNGKTTTTYLVQQMLENLKIKTGIIGTIKTYDGENENASIRTTPESSEFQKLLGKMRDNNCKACVCEVSSHALCQERVTETKFSVTAFTNLTQDHLDYHFNMENYYYAKKLLFSNEYKAARVINIDDDYGIRLWSDCLCAGDNKVITYSASGNKNAHLRCISSEYKDGKTDIEIKWLFGTNKKEKSAKITISLIGQFNIENILCAIACLLADGHEFDDVITATRGIKAAPGRMEVVSIEKECLLNNVNDDDINYKRENTVDDKRDKIENKNYPTVIVDYAHTPDALEKVLNTINDLPHKKIITVFGCGGDRDSSKRAIMGKAASRKSDKVYITSDNPRSENPNNIMNDIMFGIDEAMLAKASVHSNVDRRKAIQSAIADADKDDIVLVAGKGHETYQEIDGVREHFDDREVVREALMKWRKKQ